MDEYLSRQRSVRTHFPTQLGKLQGAELRIAKLKLVLNHADMFLPWVVLSLNVKSGKT